LATENVGHDHADRFFQPPAGTGFNAAAPHLQNYRRIYAASETRSAETGATADLDAYLSLYEEIGARHVVLKARDVETTFGFKIANETVADFCKAQVHAISGLPVSIRTRVLQRWQNSTMPFARSDCAGSTSSVSN
jgi:hypothetical protein